MRLPSLRARRAPPPVPPPPAPPTRPSSELPAHLLRRLEFQVVRRLDGFLFGDYRGLFYGPSLDLAEVREYQPGDEVRRIDWNVTARTGRLHVRQYREERELTAWLLVDTSASMAFGTRRVLKRDLARDFASVASVIVTRHGDRVGALVFGGPTGQRLLPPRTGRAQVLALLHLLQPPGSPLPGPTGASASSAFRDALESADRTLRRRSLVFVVSDFLEPTHDEEGWPTALRRLARRHDVIAVRVTDPAERSLPDVGGLRVVDPETSRQLWIDTSDPAVRAAHARLVAERDAALKQVLRGARVDLLELDTSRDLVEPLLKFTAARRGRRP